MRPILLLCSLTLAGCSLFSLNKSATAPAHNASQAHAAQLEQYRAQVRAQPGSYQPAMLFAATVKGLLPAPTAAELDRPALVDEAVGYLDAVDEPGQRYAALADKGSLLLAAERPADALAAFRASLAEEPNVMAIPDMLPTLAATGASAEIPEVCAGVRAGIEERERVNILMHHCARNGDPMAWASEEDRSAHAQFQNAQAERQAAREAERQAERERMQASFSQPEPASAPSSGAAKSAPASAPAGGSVSLGSDCKQKVRIFRGRVNGRYPGGGTFGWHSPNSTSSYSLSGSDQLCIVTENDREIVSCAGSGGRLRITSSCSGFAPR